MRLGPLIVEHRDPLGIARTRTLLLDVDEVFVAPRSYLLDMPQLGQGILGAHLLAMARRLGPGEFHGLREYVDGDEPRSIHWKASARSEQLLVKEFTTEGLRRCTVVLDASSSGYGDPEGFERAVTVAASLVHSADRAGLTTRFVTVDGIDLRGPDVAQQTLRHLARLELSSATLDTLEHDPGEGLGLLIAVGAGSGALGGAHPRDARSDADSDHRVDRAGARTGPRRRRAIRPRVHRVVERTARPGPTRRRGGAVVTALDTPVLAGTAERDRSSSRRAPTPPRIRPPGERPAKSFTSDLLASSGLVLFALAVAAGFARVFPGWGFFDDFAVIAIVGHGSGLVARRFRVAAWATIPIVMLVVFWTVGYLYYGATYSWGLPTSDTWTLFNAELDLVREQFSVAVAPVVDSGGWDVLAAIGLAIAVVLADAFAFGALARAEALVPGGVLFVFIAALGDDRLRVSLSAMLVGAGVVTTVLLRAHHAPGGITDATRGAPRVLMQAAGVAIAVALIAGYVGARLPGATSEPLLETRGVGDGDSSALSPLVDIRSRLTNQTRRGDDRRHGERRVVLAIDHAGGVRRRDLASARPRHRRARPTLPPPDPSDVELRQQVDIVGLGGTRGAGGAGSDQCRRAEPHAAAVRPGVVDTVDRRRGAVEGRQLHDRSPHRRDSSRRSWPPRPRLDPGDRIYLELPDDFPADAAALAAEVTAGAANSYEAAVRAPGLVPVGVHVQPGGPAGSREQRDRGVPARPGRLLRTVRRHLRGDDALARHSGPRGGRVHRRQGDRRRAYSVTGTQRSRLAGGVVRRSGLGAVRTDPRPWCTGSRELHGRRPGPGHLDRLPGR